MYLHKKQNMNMRLFISIALTAILTMIVTDANAQNKRVVHKKKKGKVVVHHTPKGKVVVVKNKRKRVRRTRVVHYHYKHLPRRGTMVTSINGAALSVNFRGIGYKVHSGVWYKRNANKWVVIRTPIGARIKLLPKGYRRLVVGPRTYYYYYGTYYIQSGTQYEVVSAPIGAEVGSLPDGYNTITVTGQEYYELDGIYYMPSSDDSNEEILVVVNNPNN